MNLKPQTFLFIAVFLVVFSFTTEEIQASTVQIYISVSGNDKNPGTSELPLASLQGAVDRLRAFKKQATRICR
jgi:hypothetical protein